MKKDPKSYVEDFVGKTDRCLTIPVDLEELGFVCLSSDLENGLYGGQSATPEVIAKNLAKYKIKRFVFERISLKP